MKYFVHPNSKKIGQILKAPQLEQADGLNLAAVKKRLPLPVWLSLGQWFAFAAAHERRHLWQARQVVAEANFPSRTTVEVA